MGFLLQIGEYERGTVLYSDLLMHDAYIKAYQEQDPNLLFSNLNKYITQELALEIKYLKEHLQKENLTLPPFKERKL